MELTAEQVQAFLRKADDLKSYSWAAGLAVSHELLRASRDQERARAEQAKTHWLNDIKGHWFIQGGESEFGLIRHAGNADEIVATILRHVRAALEQAERERDEARAADAEVLALVTQSQARIAALEAENELCLKENREAHVVLTGRGEMAWVMAQGLDGQGFQTELGKAASKQYERIAALEAHVRRMRPLAKNCFHINECDCEECSAFRESLALVPDETPNNGAENG